MPWSAWWESIRTGDAVPLLLAVYARAAYYFIGVYRMTRGGSHDCRDNPDD